MTNVQAMFMGLAFALFAGGVTAAFLFFTWPARRIRNALALGLGYILVGGSALGSILLLFSEQWRSVAIGVLCGSIVGSADQHRYVRGLDYSWMAMVQRRIVEVG